MGSWKVFTQVPVGCWDLWEGFQFLDKLRSLKGLGSLGGPTTLAILTKFAKLKDHNSIAHY